MKRKRARATASTRAALTRLTAAIEKREDLLPVLRDAYEDFTAIPVTERTKPVIGVVGEIYIRSNRFSNEDVVRQIESLGRRGVGRADLGVAPLRQHDRGRCRRG